MILTLICVSGMTYLLGRVDGYEKAEQHDQETISFWKDVKERGF